MIVYLRTLIAAAKKDAMTYVASALAGLAVLPEVIPQYWADVESLLPTTAPKETIHHILLGVGAIAAMWLRAHLAVKASKAQ